MMLRSSLSPLRQVSLSLSLSWSILLFSAVILCIGQVFHNDNNAASAFVPTTTDFSTVSNSYRLRSRYILQQAILNNKNQNQQQLQKQLVVGNRNNLKQSNTQLYFMGSDGGILGIGTPEVFTILLVGYFVLGPSDLFKLTKEVGKFVQNVQSFATEATNSLETTMEDQLNLEEIRKAQRELNDAFSFRRSINVDGEQDAFSVTTTTPRIGDEIADVKYDMSTTSAVDVGGGAAAVGEGAAVAAVAVAPKRKKKRIRRIKVKKPPVVDDEVVAIAPPAIIDQPQLANDVPSELGWGDVDDEFEKAGTSMMETISGSVDKNNDDDAAADDAAAQTRKERLERLERGISKEQSSATTIAAEYDVSSEQSRFQQQLSGNWNDQVLANGDKLEPLAQVMNLIALLEEEKIAADERLQEEFKSREQNEEKFYLEKRKLLEEAGAEIQASAYASINDSSNSSSDNVHLDASPAKTVVASAASTSATASSKTTTTTS